MVVRLLLIRMKEEDERAMSEPLPMAMLRSAVPTPGYRMQPELERRDDHCSLLRPRRFQEQMVYLVHRRFCTSSLQDYHPSSECLFYRRQRSPENWLFGELLHLPLQKRRALLPVHHPRTEQWGPQDRYRKDMQ